MDLDQADYRHIRVEHEESLSWIVLNRPDHANALSTELLDEFSAALEALKRPARIRLHTDSQYLRDGITRYVHGWQKNGWKTADKKPVKNEDLWRRLDEAAGRHEIDWRWVKGHAGDEMNERADALARQGMAPFLPGKGKAGAG